MDIVQFFMRTKEKILEKAKELFNETGIEYVGLREIARTLDIRVSNITYYYPTKDDLVNALWTEMNNANSTVVIQNENMTAFSFLDMLRRVFNNHFAYRCLMISFVHLLQRNKYISKHYQENINRRNEVLLHNVDTMISNGSLNALEDYENASIISNLSIIIRFWISDASVSTSHSLKQSIISEYTANLARLLIPYATEKGKKEIELFLGSADPQKPGRI